MPDTRGVKPPGPKEATGGIPVAPMVVLILGTFMAMLDSSIVNVAIPRLMTIFQVTPAEIQWVMTIYLLVGGVVIPVTGYLGDRYGYKTLYMSALGVFTVASLFCGMAWSNDSLIAARALQALGGGMLMPLSMAIIYQLVPREKMGMALGMWGIAMTVAPAIGPTLGGYLVEYFSWHLIFYINLPVGILTLILAQRALPDSKRKSGLTFDLPGFVLCAVACFSILLALSEGQTYGWGSQFIITLLALSCFSLLLFVIWELHTEQPMLDVRLFKNAVLTVSVLGSSIAMVALFSGIFLIPIFTQAVQGYTALQTGLIMMPAALATGCMMPIAGKLFDRYGAAPLAVTGLVILVITTYLLHNLTIYSTNREILFLLIIRGVGLGLCMMPLTTAGMNTVPQALVGRASAMTNVFRQIAASLGIALMTYVMTSRSIYHTATLSENVSFDNAAAVEGLRMVERGLAAAGADAVAAKAGAIGVAMGAVQEQAFVLAINDSFIVATVIIVLAIPLAAFLTRSRVEKGSDLKT